MLLGVNVYQISVKYGVRFKNHFTRLFTAENLVNIKLATVQSQMKHEQFIIFMKVRIG